MVSRHHLEIHKLLQIQENYPSITNMIDETPFYCAIDKHGIYLTPIQIKKFIQTCSLLHQRNSYNKNNIFDIMNNRLNDQQLIYLNKLKSSSNHQQRL